MSDAGVVGCEAGLYEPEQLDRVIACGFSSNLPREIEKLTARQTRESAMEAKSLGPSMIVGGRVYAGTGRYDLGRHLPDRRRKVEIRRYASANLANSYCGMRYFGHWLRDDCAMVEAIPDDVPLISLRRPNWPDTRIYERAFGQTWDEVDIARVDDLTVYSELGFSRHKAERFHLLRRRLRQAMPAGGTGRVVFVGRGPSAHPRDIVNEAELTAALSKRGVEILRPETGTDVLVSGMLDADMVITVEGSQAAHALYALRDRGSLLILQPPDRFYNPAYEWARLMGIGYGIVVGTPAAGGFTIDAGEVLRMGDRLLSMQASRAVA